MITFKNTAEIMNQFNTALEQDIVITQADIKENRDYYPTFFHNGMDDESVALHILKGMDGDRSFNAVRDLHL